ncbi:MAG: cysteine desulfurase [Rhodothermaceae bacterium]|nr:cysteine desulfurase [Rhodothermaceae bacterium]
MLRFPVVPSIYLDHAATTPLDPSVLAAMQPYLTEQFGNASSVHALGRRARVAIEGAREQVAGVLGCSSAEVVFTSGGTEGDNAALRGVLTGAALRETGRPGLVTSKAEHEAVLRTAETLAADGHPVTMLKPEAHGTVSLDPVRAVLDEHTGLVSIMLVNNEVGTISDLPTLAEVTHAAGARIHTDAVQAPGMLPLDVDVLGVDLLTLSGHKCYGPKGVGALFVRAGTPLQSLITGGAQERRRRGGTENVAAIVGFAEALVQAEAERVAGSQRLAGLQHRLATQIRTMLGETVWFNTPLDGFHPDPQPVAPHILNVSFLPKAGQPLDGEMLLLGLDVAGVYVSSGSACTSGAIEPSHVLLAMGASRDTAAATVRFSLGRSTSEHDVDYAAEQLGLIASRL